MTINRWMLVGIFVLTAISLVHADGIRNLSTGGTNFLTGCTGLIDLTAGCALPMLGGAP